MLNKLISKIGLDKITHFLAGGFIYSFLYILITGIYNYTKFEQTLIAIFLNIVVFAISYIREQRSAKFDWYDILATNLGNIIITIIAIIGIFC